MNKKQLTIYGIAIVVIQIIISCGIFVTFPSMTAYAAPKREIDTIQQQLIRIEQKIDKLILGY